MLKLSGQPGSGSGMADVVAIEERNQYIDVEQRSQSIRVLFAQSIELLIGNQSTAALERYEPANPGASRWGWGTGERPTGEIGQHGARRPIRLAGETFGRLEHVVVNFKSGTHSVLAL
jgi:hypothetical protein